MDISEEDNEVEDIHLANNRPQRNSRRACTRIHEDEEQNI
eukprot:CAMPEP_0184874580 /NCGR_PEP_ID=MMETSP0580-20130426/42480_1 /TAXON_ID=1118495 /ORGANISM="Dactyliosolen fragilissimus" /LENGTH=39 /DNA_ID= /DNA_START= /DNA_END= /DNA_ORIENTATION=